MARVVRSDVFQPREVSVLHCIQRCVRRCYLCGVDAVTGQNFDYRKAWIEERLREAWGQASSSAILVQMLDRLVLWRILFTCALMRAVPRGESRAWQ